MDVRVPLVWNADALGLVTPTAEDPVYFTNGDADDLYFVLEGGGLLRSPLGDLRFAKDDYLYVPKGLKHRLVPDGGAQRWLSIECLGGAGIPREWRNEAGQLRMDAPLLRARLPAAGLHGPHRRGRPRRGREAERHVPRLPRARKPPLDVVGWDGAVYPVAFPILSFQPRAGLVHLPPTWHGTFAARGALICSFVPRLLDFGARRDPLPLSAREASTSTRSSSTCAASSPRAAASAPAPSPTTPPARCTAPTPGRTRDPSAPRRRTRSR